MGALTDARAEIMAVVARIQADWTAYPLVVEPDNRIVVDQATQTNPYLQVSIKMLSGEQLDMADRPKVEQRGQILLCVVVKENSGSAKAQALLDFLTPYFELQDFAQVRCHAFQAVSDSTVKGLTYYPGIINFWFTRNSGQ